MNLSPRATDRSRKIPGSTLLPAMVLAMGSAWGDPLPDQPVAPPPVPQEQKIPEPTAAAVLTLLGGLMLVRRWKTGAR